MVSYPAAVLDSENLYITYTYNRKQLQYTKVRLATLHVLIVQAKEKNPVFFKEQDKDTGEDPLLYLRDFYFAHNGLYMHRF